MQQCNNTCNNTCKLPAASGETAAITARNNELYPHVKAGDLAAREQMIVNNVPFARWLTSAYLRRWPRYSFFKQDLESEAFIGLINGVDGLRNQTNGKVNPAGYISRAIQRQLAAAAIKKTRSMSSREEVLKTDMNRLPQRPNGVPDLLDAIMAACETDLDRQLVLLRAERYTFREIGVLIHVNYSTLCTWLKRIKARFDAITATN